MISAILLLEQKQHVSDYAASIMNSFKKDVLPSGFGLNAISRLELWNYECLYNFNVFPNWLCRNAAILKHNATFLELKIMKNLIEDPQGLHNF